MHPDLAEVPTGIRRLSAVGNPTGKTPGLHFERRRRRADLQDASYLCRRGAVPHGASVEISREWPSRLAEHFNHAGRCRTD